MTIVNRRTTLKLGATSLLGSLVTLSEQALANTSSKNLSQHSLALFDSRFDESIAFANTLKSKDAPIIDIAEGLSTLWYSQLRNQLMIERKVLIGLTDRRELFCLEELARDVGMKVSLRVDHLIHTNGLVEHQINGLSLDHLGHEIGFGEKMAELADISAFNQTVDILAQKLTGPYAPLNKTALVTWIIS